MDTDAYKILAVDDNPKNLRVLSALMSSDNFVVDYALSGAEALKLIALGNYDVVLLDIMMPELDGFETCVRIKAERRNEDLPIIFLTAKTESESITRAFGAGGFDYITKPFRIDELLARVKTHAQLKRLREQQKEANRWLEEKVEERTAALTDSNAQLEKANAELKALDVAKNEFMRMINHEIRTPLNAILGFTDILKSELKSTKIFELVHYLDIASLRLEKFLMVVLQITELRTSNKPIGKDSVQVNKIITSAKTGLKDVILAKNIQIGVEGDALNIYIPGNSKLLHSCFTAVLENAVNYSDSDTSITLQTHEMQGKVIVECIDEGQGFSRLALSTLFQPFALGQQHVDQNAGLGLALVKLIMDAHQGLIEIFNNPVKGATVRLTFTNN